MFYFRTVTVNPPLPERIKNLRDLAYNLWFSWHYPAQHLFREINPRLWDRVAHNPVKFLLFVSREDLERAAADDLFVQKYEAVVSAFNRYMQGEKWYSHSHPRYSDKVIAYFSAEFGLHESCPIYSGGLGILAGDYAKSASDLGLPLVGVGLLYKYGYFSQLIGRDGRQEVLYKDINFNELPITPVLDACKPESGIAVELPGRTVWAKVWEMKVGLVRILLLDTDLPVNTEEDRRITSRLYGGGREMRIAQEVLLGVGGVRALKALDITPHVWHINEGHAAFLTLERLREMVAAGVPASTAREVIRANTIFTTHTPVPAGHDVFSRELVDRHLRELCRGTGMECNKFIELGWDAEKNEFNMTLLALRMAGVCNGVSRLHGEVTRQMFHRFYPAVPVEEVPVTSITNGVHTGSWIAEEWKHVFTKYFGQNWWERVTSEDMWQRVEDIPDVEIWETHMLLKEKAINFAREKIINQRRRNREAPGFITEAGEILLPQALTIGFARRFTTYKRATLIFQDPDRLAAILNDPDRPVQIIFAGKAHPADFAGQEIIHKINDFARDEPFRGKIVFLEDYDINIARILLQGVDVWLNTPRWPQEASGTSGMKAALNGVLHCSVLDGWWPEAYNGKNGFAIGHPGNLRFNKTDQDWDDSYYLYQVIEEGVVPLYYERQNGIPLGWVNMMRESFRTIIPRFCTARMVKEYVERIYVPAIERNLAMRKSHYELAEQMDRFKRFIQENWHHVEVVKIRTNGRWDMQAGEELVVESEVRLGPIAPQEVVVEIALGSDRGAYLSHLQNVPMQLKKRLTDGLYLYTGSVPLFQGTHGYAVRVRPNNRLMISKFELPLIKWAENF